MCFLKSLTCCFSKDYSKCLEKMLESCDNKDKLEKEETKDPQRQVPLSLICSYYFIHPEEYQNTPSIPPSSYQPHGGP